MFTWEFLVALSDQGKQLQVADLQVPSGICPQLLCCGFLCDKEHGLCRVIVLTPWGTVVFHRNRCRVTFWDRMLPARSGMEAGDCCCSHPFPPQAAEEGGPNLWTFVRTQSIPCWLWPSLPVPLGSPGGGRIGINCLGPSVSCAGHPHPGVGDAGAVLTHSRKLWPLQQGKGEQWGQGEAGWRVHIGTWELHQFSEGSKKLMWVSSSCTLIPSSGLLSPSVATGQQQCLQGSFWTSDSTGLPGYFAWILVQCHLDPPCTVVGLLSCRRSWGCCWSEERRAQQCRLQQLLWSCYSSWQALCDLVWALHVLGAVCWHLSASCVLRDLWGAGSLLGSGPGVPCGCWSSSDVLLIYFWLGFIPRKFCSWISNLLPCTAQVWWVGRFVNSWTRGSWKSFPALVIQSQVSVLS